MRAGYDFHPEPGDFEVVPVGGYGGTLIRVGQWLNGEGFRDYEHARLYVGGNVCVEAEPKGARIVPLKLRPNALWSTGLIPLTDEERGLICTAGRNFVGTGYSSMDYFALAARRLKFGLLVPGLKNYVESSGHVICSQLVDKAYQAAGVELFDDKRWNGYVTPASLANILKILLRLGQGARTR